MFPNTFSGFSSRQENYDYKDSNEIISTNNLEASYFTSNVNFEHFNNAFDDANKFDLQDMTNDGPSDFSTLNYAYISSKEIVEPLGPEEVRWFYKYENDKKWTSFIGYDSLQIEFAYREMIQKSTTYVRDIFESKIFISHDSKQEVASSARPVVCGGLYEVDVSLKKGFSIYWKADEFTIMRGTWFYDGSWIPLDENISEKIDVEHLTYFQGQTMTYVPMKEANEEVVHSLTLNEGQIDWFSACEVYFSHHATRSRLMKSVGKKLGFQKTGYKLQRGYCLDASSTDKPQDITHIVFVIHGIGQKMERGRIIKNCKSLRDNVKWLKEKYFSESVFAQENVEFFPVEWRSSLTLDGGIIDTITPHKIIGLRQMLNASFMDIMYYNIPQYREEIVNGLTSELDRLYTMFTARNPYFEANGGKVSVIAHSLGCVITYDIVTGWCPAPQMSQSFLQALIDLTNQKSCKDDERTLYTFQTALQHVLQQQLEKTSQPRLKFKIANFFCLGSPLAVFLALRIKRDESSLPIFNMQNSFGRMYNLFHPADPVAYRIEPLVCQKYSVVAPVTIHSYTATDKIPYDDIPLEPLNQGRKENEAGKIDPLFEQLDLDLPTSFSLPTTPNKAGASWNIWNLMKSAKKGSENISNNKPIEEATDSLKHRIDFVLREGSMESSYLSALTSHTSYWGNVDVAYFLLSTLCTQILEHPKAASLNS